MQPATPPTLRPITDSPWYWAYLFCTGGLLALVVIGPKYAVRQSQIEQNGQKRQWAAQLAAGADRTDAPTTSNPQSIPLWPLVAMLGSVLSLAWIKLIRDHLRRRAEAAAWSRSVAPPGSRAAAGDDDPHRGPATDPAPLPGESA